MARQIENECVPQDLFGAIYYVPIPYLARDLPRRQESLSGMSLPFLQQLVM